MNVGPEPSFDPADGPEDPAFRHYSDACARSLAALLGQDDRHPAIGVARTLAGALDRPALDAAARHPLYRHWRAQLPARVASGDTSSVSAWLDHLPRFLLGAALRTGSDLPGVRVPLSRGGQLRLPGLPGHLELGPDAGPEVLVGQSDGVPWVEHRGRTGEYPLVAGGAPRVDHPVLPGTGTGTGIELDATDPWFVDSITDANAASDSPEYRRRDITPASATEHQELFGRAARLIDLAWPACLAELAAHVSVIVPIDSVALAGWTTVTQLGAIYLRPGGINADDGAATGVVDDPVMYTAEAMVHEGGHTRLQVLSLGQPLFADGAASRPLRSPLRKDVRPAGGVYHAAFVLARMTVFLCRAAAATGRTHYLARAAECHHDLTVASEELFAQVALSPPGRRLLEEAVTAADAAYAGNRTASGVMS
ncbi:aKG-HExxH-type peptide beta-hydroxylase [Cryptosporangium sp. NPDC051539]|uniref:aKG-HExxH-type peptide beta-hydroxylase n=1 Tax=Cryptosporangium sp. NPDC051539 TaxID=3363962 RepID=UPI0037939D35